IDCGRRKWHQGNRIVLARNDAAARAPSDDGPGRDDDQAGAGHDEAAVLYVNISYPQLRQSMPDWSERAKFIHKTWRGLSSEDRQIYVQKARFNRAQREKFPRPRGPRNPTMG
ncbi:hypothetical protein PENTCL1PPCAC_432, partial [Pristionchus entomophagus]